MDLIEVRRKLLMTDSGSYIKDGLVLWMDGIDKGNVSGAWVDKVAGHIFTNENGFTDGSNYVGLNGLQTQYFKNTTFPAQVRSTSTIEAVMKDYSNPGILFMPKSSGIAFGVRASGVTILWTAGNTGNENPVDFTGSPIVFSINHNVAIFDGAEQTFWPTSNGWAGPDSNNYIGTRYTSGAFSTTFTGKVYSLRIYNRLLTKEEILHNQRIDNRRFNLGLTI